MPRHRPLRLFVLASTLTVGAGACSSDDQRDQFYGTDVGANWTIPDGSIVVARDAGGDAATRDGSRDGGDAATEAGMDGAAADALEDVAAPSDTNVDGGD